MFYCPPKTGWWSHMTASSQKKLCPSHQGISKIAWWHQMCGILTRRGLNRNADVMFVAKRAVSCWLSHQRWSQFSPIHQPYSQRNWFGYGSVAIYDWLSLVVLNFIKYPLILFQSDQDAIGKGPHTQYVSILGKWWTRRFGAILFSEKPI